MCVQAHCMSNLLECTGASDVSELPFCFQDSSDESSDEDENRLPGSMSPYTTAHNAVVAVGLLALAAAVASML